MGYGVGHETTRVMKTGPFSKIYLPIRIKATDNPGLPAKEGGPIR
jgi:hypothetical protein